MNRQEAFDKAYKGIVAQGCRSYDEISCVCQYRGPNNAKCAVGHLVTDEQIAAHNINNGDGVWAFPLDLVEEILPGDHEAKSFLADLQGVHDGMFGVIDFKRRAAEFAERFNLTVPAV